MKGKILRKKKKGMRSFEEGFSNACPLLISLSSRIFFGHDSREKKIYIISQMKQKNLAPPSVFSRIHFSRGWKEQRDIFRERQIPVSIEQFDLTLHSLDKLNWEYLIELFFFFLNRICQTFMPNVNFYVSPDMSIILPKKRWF